MNHYSSAKRNALSACLLLGPLFQFIGDGLWVNHNFSYAWSLWREASYIFFIPVGFLLAKILEPKNTRWAMMACALYVVGCFGAATMMPLFRLGGFYTVSGHDQFPQIVQSVLDRKGFAATLFLPGLCFPLSFIAFGIGFLKYKVLPPFYGFAFLASGILFWLGNAGEIDAILIAGDAWMIIVFFCLGSLLFRQRNIQLT